MGSACSGPPKQNQSASWGNRHVANSASGGRPENAVGFLSEGNFAVGKSKENRFAETYEEQALQLGTCGVTKEDWEIIRSRLQNKWKVVFKGDFKKEIQKLNDEVFVPKGLRAVYAEYGAKGGQAAVTIYTQEQWDKLPK